MRKTTITALLSVLALTGSYAQQKKKAEAGKADLSTFKMPNLDSLNKPLAYNKVVTDKAVIKKGLMNLIKVGNKYYLEIPPTAMNKDVLVVNRIAKGAADLQNVYAGDEINEMIISFSLNKDRTVVNVSKKSFSVLGTNPGDEMYENVKRSNTQPISYSWPVKTTAPDSSKVVEITDLLKGDEPLITFNTKIKKNMKLGTMVTDINTNYIQEVAAYPQNLNFKMVKTYTGGSATADALSVVPGMNPSKDDSKYTFELNSSWILLPEKPLRMREYDPRVGYFYKYFKDFSADPRQVKGRAMATRYRLEPKPEDVQRYLAGELVEPQKPIIYYIDPTTPKKWIPYLMQGVNAWQRSFEKAGFKNAIMAKLAPTKEQDSTWSLDDARYSAIVYKPSEVINAEGPHVGDPRTGEIIEAHINWYHNIMIILQNWYMMQVGAVDPRARKASIDDDLMGELIRFVASHEVGHTLGLRHNFIASNATPVELLRNKEWVEKNGHTSSIMDYARFNYVAQPEDNIGPAGLFPRVNDYDDWAIEWGYRWMGNIDQQQEKEKLAAMATASIKNPRLRWGATAELPGIPDPRAQTEDLGDNQMKANTYGMKNLQYVAKHLPEWTVVKGESYDKLRMANLYGLITQYFNYVRHTIGYIGGVYGDNTNSNDGAPNRFKPAPLERQKEALAFVSKWAFEPQEWLYNNEGINGKITDPYIQAASQNLKSIITEKLMDQLLNETLLVKMANLNERFPNQGYQLSAYLQDLQDKLWSDLNTSGKIDPSKQEIQALYLKKLALVLGKKPESPMEMLAPVLAIVMGGGQEAPKNSNATALAILSAETLRDRINVALKSGKFTNTLTKAHLKASLMDLNNMLNKK